MVASLKGATSFSQESSSGREKDELSERFSVINGSTLSFLEFIARLIRRESRPGKPVSLIIHTCCVCVFVWLRISPPRIKLAVRCYILHGGSSASNTGNLPFGGTFSPGSPKLASMRAMPTHM